jgi:hypothetical protein
MEIIELSGTEDADWRSRRPDVRLPPLIIHPTQQCSANGQAEADAPAQISLQG